MSAEAALAAAGAVFLDCRAGAAGRAAFLEAHVPGAHYADLERDLAKVGDPAAGGRHPLPTATEFGITLGEWGVSEQTPVFVYDDSSGAMAATRAWWMLRSIGHQKAFLVDGGWSALLAALPAAGLSPESGAQDSGGKAPPYPTTGWQWPTVSREQVERALEDERWLVIDVRSAERYAGVVEPYDPVAGHIPRAKNLPYSSSLDEEGRFLERDRLRRLFEDELGEIPPERTIVHCGSGVTACHTLAAMAEAGLVGAHLYVGSYSEWSRSGLPVETEDDPDLGSAT